MHARTLVFIFGIASGVALGYGSPFASEIAVLLFILGVVQLVIYFFERKHDTHGIVLSLWTLLFSFAVCIGIIRVQLVNEKSTFVCEVSCMFEAKVVTSPDIKNEYQVFIVRPIVDGGKQYDVQVRTPIYPRHQIGEVVRLRGKVSVPDTIYPHDGKKSFDYLSYLHTRNVGSQMMFPNIEVLDHDVHTFPDLLGRWKESLIERMNAFVSSPASSIATGMLFGNSSMSKEMTDTFRVAGLSHIVVLSGFNIAIVIAFVLFLFAFLPLVVRVVLAAFFVILFVLMVGGEVSVLRATAMAFIALFALLVGRQYVARQALALSLLCIILYEPYALLNDVSLHLSFIATAGIVYMSERVQLFVQKFLTSTFAVELVTLSFAAYLATLPYVLYAFGSASVYALVANVLVLPLVPIAMLLSFITVIAGYLSSSVAMVCGYVTTLLIDCMIAIAEMVESLPFSSISLSVSFSTMCFLYVVVTGVCFYFFAKRENETLQTSPEGYMTEILKY